MIGANRLGRIRHAIWEMRWLWITITIGFPVFYYLILLVSLLIRFQALPNYASMHDWLGSVIEIWRSTPSPWDMAPIIAEEWLFEIGRMNYSYGTGVSEWSLNIIPFKVLIVFILSSLISTVVALVRKERSRCSALKLRGASATGGLGAILVSMTSVTLSWVVCCATPSWVVGLAILGLGVSTSLWLEQFGWWIEYVGFAFLIAAIFWLSKKPQSEDEAKINFFEHAQLGESQ